MASIKSSEKTELQIIYEKQILKKPIKNNYFKPTSFRLMTYVVSISLPKFLQAIFEYCHRQLNFAVIFCVKNAIYQKPLPEITLTDSLFYSNNTTGIGLC